MAEMIGTELKLKAVGGSPVRRGHHAGVVDQQVDIVIAGSDVGSERSYRAEVGHVEPCSLHGGRWKGSRDCSGRLCTSRAVAARDDHLRPMPGELAGDNATE